MIINFSKPTDGGGNAKVSIKATGTKLAYSTFEKVPEIYDFTGVEDYSFMFCYSDNLNEFEMKEPMPPTGTAGMMFDGISTAGSFYYHTPGDYSKIIEQLPSTWTAYPIGELTMRFSVLKDCQWLSGTQSLTMNGVTAVYEGKGIYSITDTFTKGNCKSKSKDLLLNGAKIGEIEWKETKQTVEAGDNSSIIKENVISAQTIAEKTGRNYNSADKCIDFNWSSGYDALTVENADFEPFNAVEIDTNCPGAGGSWDDGGYIWFSGHGLGVTKSGNHIYYASDADNKQGDGTQTTVQFTTYNDVYPYDGVNYFKLKSFRQIDKTYPPYPEV